ncbi:hypothetical protein HanHA300_Chr08g0296331 [Helianthus annuus]|nr:hypothetical protein HanHA300_Chr08g0296331 [Helianthus annuus]KAJ0555013.1 hypothetical protein HanHA89_Chr08g0314841 [Helianthus annuus]KAJ0720581.1 hypothetical protein HanLR1_Chr08g0295201 [Helianthus annuus]KAJ0723776.1 hypothetical protein HanOQP8_Chr08g0302361 [Helianthus annuus]
MHACRSVDAVLELLAEGVWYHFEIRYGLLDLCFKLFWTLCLMLPLNTLTLSTFLNPVRAGRSDGPVRPGSRRCSGPIQLVRLFQH